METEKIKKAAQILTEYLKNNKIFLSWVKVIQLEKQA